MRISHFVSSANVFGLVCLSFIALAPARAADEPFRPPAIPLVTHDPYFSVWSMADRLTDDWTKHWTGTINAMCGLARIDGKAYRFMAPAQLAVPPMKQVGVKVWPTRTIYDFEQAGVHLKLTFTTPALLDDLNILARPVTYITWDARCVDGKQHAVSLYFDATGEWVVNKADQPVVWGRYRVGDMNVLRIGSKDQVVLGKSGDNLRIDWGYLTLAIPPQGPGATQMASDTAARRHFIETGTLGDTDDLNMPRPARQDWPVLAATFDLGNVGSKAVSRHLLIAYDDGYAIEYHHQKLRPYWRRRGMDMPELLRLAEHDYGALRQKCARFDREITADLDKAGGAHYAQLCTLAFRQCVAAHKLVADNDGTPLYFSKENFSNGCIDTVDVTCPSCPFFLLFNTRLLAGQLIPILDYASMPRWKHPYAPHDLGTYPKANGQVYGGREESDHDQMPVEECGNMLLMMAALAKTDDNADLAKRYWPLMSRWANYLKDKGLDPENQLCTDDFAGHLAHNTNLSVKAIVALGGYSLLCDMVGKKDEAAAFRKTASDMARQWTKMADDGDHYRLAFDRPGTWSQEYNLVWDKLLGLDLFPPEVARKAIAYYKTKQNKYGLPLDNRKAYTKLDWTVWTATLAENAADFQALTEPLYRFANESRSRVPLTDWYWTSDAKQAGFQARSTVGGIYIKLLADPEVWKKWSRRAAASEPRRWTKQRANAWYGKQPWLVGSNFIPSTAINQLEMWQADTFDPKTIDRELGWAEDLRMNTMRVFLHDLAWEEDPAGFKKRVGQYLAIADKHKIRTLFVLFDDCWNQHPKIGKQPAPRPGIHNSGWVQSPGTDVVLDATKWPRLERYVNDVLTTFGKDDRVLAWDLYNEPGNNNLGDRSLPLLAKVFEWAHTAGTSQPVTVGVWFSNAKLNALQLAESDVITFHNYNKADSLRAEIHDLKKLGRPVICTEYMARTHGSRFATHLPVFKEEKVGCYNWGFVSGKTNTIYPWGSPGGGPEPATWFHDILRRDGTPFDPAEIEAIKNR